MAETEQKSDTQGDTVTVRQRTVLRVCWTAVMIFFVVLGALSVRKGWYEPPAPGQTPEQARRRKHRGTDFTAYYSAGELARKGHDIYDWPSSSTPFRPFIYPPIFAIIPMMLLSVLPHNAALGVFYVLNVALLFGSAWLLRKMLWPPGEALAGKSYWRLPDIGIFIAIALCMRFLDSNLKLGNANVIILFFITLGLYALHSGKGVWSGLAVAYATAVKATPGLFGIYFLWSRRGWAMVGGAVGLLIFLIAIPTGILGWQQNADALAKFAGEAGVKFASPKREETQSTNGAEEEGPRAEGISLRGTMLKLFSSTVSMHHRKEGDTRSVNILNLAPETTTRLATLVSVILLGLTIWLTAGQGARVDGMNLALSWGLVAVTMLLVSPLTRKGHCVVLLIPVIALIALLQQERLTNGVKKAAWFALVFLPVAALFTGEGLLGERASEYLHAIGTSTWAMVVLYVATAMALWQRRGTEERGTRSAEGEGSTS